MTPEDTKAGAEINYGAQYSQGYKAPTDGVAEDPGMPAGFQQEDSDMTPAQRRKVQIATYGLSLLGLLLIPLALLLRTGRWSTRTLMCHHKNWEFGGW